MCRTTVATYLITRWTINVISLRALLGALLVVANLPVCSLAGVPGTNNGNRQPGIRSGRAPVATSTAAGRGRHLVLQVRGSG